MRLQKDVSFLFAAICIKDLTCKLLLPLKMFTKPLRFKIILLAIALIEGCSFFVMSVKSLEIDTYGEILLAKNFLYKDICGVVKYHINM